MPTIIESTPRGKNKIKAQTFDRLRDVSGNANPGIGGRFALPSEFDSENLASSFVLEGNEVLARAQDEPVVNTRFYAEGWKPWKYPDTTNELFFNEEGKASTEARPHPNAGKVHKVPGLSKNDGTYVLLCRPMAVQVQVNEAYAQLSREMTENEIKGEVSTANVNNDRGILTDALLKKEIGKEAEIEGYNPDEAVLHHNLKQDQGRISVQDQTVKTRHKKPKVSR